MAETDNANNDPVEELPPEENTEHHVDVLVDGAASSGAMGNIPSEGSADYWAAPWLQEVEDIMTIQTIDCNADVSLDLSMPNTEGLSLPTVIIDCGATSSVVGMVWLAQWTKWTER